MISMNIRIEKRAELKEKPKKGEPLGFGDIFTDHMFLMDYTEGKGWHDARIVPYAPLSLDPAPMVFHYAPGRFTMLLTVPSDFSVRI